MIPYPAIWEGIFNSPAAPKVLLLTLSAEGLDPFDSNTHLARHPTSFRFATHPDATVPDSASGKEYPFWCMIRSWPTVERVLMRESRRAEISDIQIEIAAESGLARRLYQHGRGLALTGRLDLWSPAVFRSGVRGIQLTEVIPIAAGLCTINNIPRLDGPVTITLTDGDPDRSVNFPASVFSSADFSTTVEGVLDKIYMTTIFGPMPEDVLLIPIEVDPTTGVCARWFLSTPPMTTPVTTVKVDGVVLAPVEWTMRSGQTDSRVFFSEVVLKTPVSADTPVAASGGVGLTNTNLLLYLLDYAKYPITPEARSYLAQFTGLDFSALLNESGTVLDLVNSRFLPQTRFVGTFEHGRYHVIDLQTTTPSFHLSVGETGLLYRLAEQPALSDAQNVFNAFEIRCGRNHAASSASSTAPLVRIILDKEHGPAVVREFLARSEVQWRRRAAPPIEAADLPVLYDHNSLPVSCPAGEALAVLQAVIHAFRHSLHTYQCDWRTGMRLAWGQYGTLTDAAMGFVRKPVRVARWALPATGPQVALQTDDGLEG